MMSNALRIFVLGLLVASCGKVYFCDFCGEGTLCDTNSGKCVAKVGGNPSACSPACTGTKPICDDVTNAQNPHCVQCLNDAQCNGGTCRMSSQTCAPTGSGGGAGGGSGGGAGGSAGGGMESGGGTGGDMGGGSGGSSGGAAGGTGGGMGTGGGGTGGGGVLVCPGGAPAWNFTPDAGAQAGQFTGTGSCAPQDGGVGGSCIPACNEGFTCQGGVCVLNGGNGPVQITLRWNSLEDLDLHVLEPTAAGGCEIAYTDTNRPGDPSSCGAKGWLDLDSEPGCAYDYVDTENVIYSPGAPAPCGTYTVWVNHYANCNPALTIVPFELEARFAGMSVGICGAFVPTDADWDNGNQDQSRFMMTFTVP